jgi:methionyl-tRNA synthetase
MVETVAPHLTASDAPAPNWAANLQEKVNNAIDVLAFDKALQKIWEVISQADELIEKEKPWQHAQGQGKVHAQSVLHQLVGVLKEIGIALEPLLPTTSKEIDAALASAPLRKPAEPLFTRQA